MVPVMFLSNVLTIPLALSIIIIILAISTIASAKEVLAAKSPEAVLFGVWHLVRRVQQTCRLESFKMFSSNMCKVPTFCVTQTYRV